MQQLLSWHCQALLPKRVFCSKVQPLKRIPVCTPGEWWPAVHRRQPHDTRKNHQINLNPKQHQGHQTTSQLANGLRATGLGRVGGMRWKAVDARITTRPLGVCVFSWSNEGLRFKWRVGFNGLNGLGRPRYAGHEIVMKSFSPPFQYVASKLAGHQTISFQIFETSQQSLAKDPVYDCTMNTMAARYYEHLWDKPSSKL